MPAEDDRGLRDQEQHEHGVDHQHRREPLETVGHRTQHPLAAIDRRRVEGEVAAGEHHAADEERDERAQGEVLGAEVGYDGADPLGEQRVGGREEQCEDGEPDGRENGGPRHRCLVAETGDDPQGAAQPRQTAEARERPGDGGEDEARNRPPAHQADRAEAAAGEQAEDGDPLRVPHHRHRRERQAQRGAGQGERVAAVATGCEQRAARRDEDDEHPETEVAVGQHDPGQYADAERAEQHPEVAGQRRLGPEVAEDPVGDGRGGRRRV